MRNFLFFISLSLYLSGCILNSKNGNPDVRYYNAIKPPKPDYYSISLNSWAAHPDLIDESDVGLRNLHNDSIIKDVDVFFIYPTIYTYKPKDEYQWNANVYDNKLNKKIDKTTIRFQASIFNTAGNVYAPRYRQAHVAAFYTPFKEDRDSSLNLAYSDVKKAFLVYLEKWNNGKPFIIAAHSQGTVHAIRLVKELIDGQEIQKQLVAAYLVGMPVSTVDFKSIKPCNDSDDINCLISWCTYARNYYPNQGVYLDNEKNKKIVQTNPLSWRSDSNYVDASHHKGGVILNIRKKYPKLCDAQNHNGMLWISHPKFPGSVFLKNIKNYHVGDYNLFYLNVQQNAKLRSNTFLKLK